MDICNTFTPQIKGIHRDTYRIAGNNIIHQYEFSGYYKPLAPYHFVKLKFIKCYFEVNLSNLFLINISDYMVSHVSLLYFLTRNTFKGT